MLIDRDTGSMPFFRNDTPIPGLAFANLPVLRRSGDLFVCVTIVAPGNVCLQHAGT